MHTDDIALEKFRRHARSIVLKSMDPNRKNVFEKFADSLFGGGSSKRKSTPSENAAAAPETGSEAADQSSADFTQNIEVSDPKGVNRLLCILNSKMNEPQFARAPSVEIRDQWKEVR